MKNKIKFIDYHGRRAGVFSAIAKKLSGREDVFSSGGLPSADGGAYKQESDLIVGRKYAEPFRGTEVDGLVKIIENTRVGPVNVKDIENTDLVLPLHPHILECMGKARLPVDNAISLMKYLDVKNDWFDAPDYTIQRALADQKIIPVQEHYNYVSVLTGETALEGSPEAFRLYSQDTIETTKRLIEKLREGGELK